METPSNKGCGDGGGDTDCRYAGSVQFQQIDPEQRGQRGQRGHAGVRRHPALGRVR